MDHLHALPLSSIRIDDGFWNRYTRLVPKKVLPYQWDILNDNLPDVPASHCLNNFRIAAGEVEGERLGHISMDSDAYKWLEAVAYSLASDKEGLPADMAQDADQVINLIGRAQCDDGYLHTYYTCVEPNARWTNLTEGHELYCAGHLVEAAVAYYDATGKRKLLDIACRFVDLICSIFGSGENQMHGYPGHPEIELALVRLYHATGTDRYLELAKYFIDVRGQTPNYFLEEMKHPDFHHTHDDFKNYDPAYSQSHLPVRQQHTAEGHAVRATYLYCAMADIADLTGDEELLNRCKDIWDNIVERRMFITGGIGSSGFCERFTTDYDLPNDSCYCETCASVGLAMFGLRMARITKDARYIDTVERALYNTVRAGIALSGDRYFYVNPLEVWPDICMEHTSRAHVKPVRQKWFDVACCPTNIARTLTSLGQYIYSANNNSLYVNLFVQNNTTVEIGNKPVQIHMTTDYPKTGRVHLSVKAKDTPFTLYVRLPNFAKKTQLHVNGEASAIIKENGFAVIQRVWNNDEVELSFDIKAQFVYANPLVRANTGKMAIMRGPEVFCFEEVDNGTLLSSIELSEDIELKEEWSNVLLGGTMVVHCTGKKVYPQQMNGTFSDQKNGTKQPMELTAIPYGLWNNRQPGEMIVWVREET